MAVTDSTTELLAVNPDAIAREVTAALAKLSTDDSVSSELEYTPTSEHSYYRDMLAIHGHGESRGAQGRLDHHGEQMTRIAADRAERARRALTAFEFRVEPNRTDGQGGYFSPPIWLNQLFATANRPRRVLADLMPKFPLPAGVSQVNLPLLTTGSLVQPNVDLAAVADQDVVDSAGSSPAAPFEGQADVALQLLEQSPPGAHLDWAIFRDLSESYDAQLETALLFGAGGTGQQAALTGVMILTGTNQVAYTGATTGAAMYPYFGRAIAQIGDNRDLPPECFLMRTARWAWIKTSEDTATMPFDLTTKFYLGSTDDTPDPIGGIANFPVFLDDAIPANVTATTNQNVTTYATGGTQDVIICLRPSDGILLEGEPQTIVAREPLSGGLGVRIGMHAYAAAITGRHPAGVSVLCGTGMAVQTGF